MYSSESILEMKWGKREQPGLMIIVGSILQSLSKIRTCRRVLLIHIFRTRAAEISATV